jgi:hypothetical protein
MVPFFMPICFGIFQNITTFVGIKFNEDINETI